MAEALPWSDSTSWTRRQVLETGLNMSPRCILRQHSQKDSAEAATNRLCLPKAQIHPMLCLVAAQPTQRNQRHEHPNYGSCSIKFKQGALFAPSWSSRTTSWASRTPPFQALSWYWATSVRSSFAYHATSSWPRDSNDPWALFCSLDSPHPCFSL